MDLSYLSALLERHPYILGYPPQSHKVLVIEEFLEKVVDVVPLESVGYAIAYGNDHVADECLKIIDDCCDDIHNSVLMRKCFDRASGRVMSGLPIEVHDDLVRSFQQEGKELYYWYECNPEQKTICLSVAPRSDSTNKVRKTFSFDEIKQKYNVVPKHMDSISILWLNAKLVNNSFKPNRIICDMNISCLYTLSQNEMLQSPIKTLYSGKKTLASLADNTQHESSESSCSPRSSADMACLGNSLMLKTVNDIREKELAICTSLLAGFMEHTDIDIPLMKSDKDRSKALELSARASVGVWALSSLNFEHIQPILKQCHGEQLLVKIEEYIKLKK